MTVHAPKAKTYRTITRKNCFVKIIYVHIYSSSKKEKSVTAFCHDLQIFPVAKHVGAFLLIVIFYNHMIIWDADMFTVKEQLHLPV